MGVMRRGLIGFVFGAIATVPMTGEFWLARRAGLIDELPPHKAVRSVASALREPSLSRVSALAHVLVGASAGALYSALVPGRFRGPVSGAIFGIVVWAVGYEVVMPGATSLPPAHRDRRNRAVTILIAHLVYGVTLGCSISSLRPHHTATRSSSGR